MAYTIRNTDGTTLVLLGDGKVDTNSTSLTLVGKNYGNYGEIWNNNLIKLMGHFAYSSAPLNPVKGQLYYNTITKKLNIYDEEWEPLNGARISTSVPSTLSEGDLWWDENNNQLYIETEAGIKLVGPNFSSLLGDNGWVLPPIPIQDNTNGSSGNVKDITLLRNRGFNVGLISNSKFNIASTSTYDYITTATTSTVKGLTILGDIKATENIYTNTLTVTSSIIYPISERVVKLAEIGPANRTVDVAIENFAFNVLLNPPNDWIPQFYSIMTSTNILAMGYFVKISESSPVVINQSTVLGTTSTQIVTGKKFDDVGDMLQMVLTDNDNFKSYRVTIQLLGTGNKVSFVLERIL